VSKRLKVLLARGFFPKELPPPFRTVSFASLVAKSLKSLPAEFDSSGAASKTISFNLARVGILRRELGIPNPISYFRLAREITDNWPGLAAHCSKSKIALTTPRFLMTSDRAIEGQRRLSELPMFRAKSRTSGRYLLTADIARCYPSIYTHAIPWALHGKSVAKKKFHSKKLLGNRLDIATRNCQDRQTVGVPIGPDASFLLSEVVLSAVDKALPRRLFTNGYRYIDDYEFSFSVRADAERALGELQQGLSIYELDLNGLKTSIKELPEPTDKLWATELRLFDLEAPNDRTAEYKLMRFFDRAFELAREDRNDYVLNYAIARLGTLTFNKRPWRVLQNLLLQKRNC
jgi:hypothetical protein